MKIRFGPAGLGPVKEAEKNLEEYKEQGFETCEIAFTYGVYIKNDEDAIRIGKKAKELGIELSIHGQYWINLNSDEIEKREASKKRILDCCRTGELLQAKVVVFHPGFYGKSKNKEKAYENIKKGIEEIQNEMKKRGWKIKIAPETMGKVNVFGSVDEIGKLVKDTGCSFCIDFAHILAREKVVDYGKIKKVFPNKEWHCHFSGIVYGEKGEKKHKKTEIGEWKKLFKNLKNIGIGKEIRIINESPSMIIDSKEGLKLWKN
jgi:deoxyribonuclease IV